MTIQVDQEGEKKRNLEKYNEVMNEYIEEVRRAQGKC